MLMTRKPGPTLAMRLVGGLLTVAAALLVCLPAASAEPTVTTYPAAGERTISPLRLSATFPGPGGTLRLLDGEGHTLPPTGPGVVTEGSSLVFHNPNLEAGKYRLEWKYGGAEGATEFIVTTGRADFEPETAAGTEQSGFNFLPLGVGALLALLLTTALRRRPLVALPFAALILSAGAGTSWVLSQKPPLDLTACVTIGETFGPERQDCASEWVLSTAGTDPVQVVDAIRVVSDEKRLGVSEEQPCHNVSHAVGREIANRGGDVTALAKNDPGLCAWGLTHGALERKAVLSTDDEWAAIAADVCDGLGEQAAMQCAHGLGHANALRSNSNLSYSYDICDELISDLLVSACAEGATMNWTFRLQYAAAAALPTEGPIDRSLIGNPQVPFLGPFCRELDGPLRAGCWRGAFLYLASTALLRDPDLPNEISDVISYCRDLGRDALACIYTSTYHAGDFPRAITQEESVAACATLAGEQRIVCMQGNVEGWLSRGAESGREYSLENRSARCATFTRGFTREEREACVGPKYLDPFTLERVNS